MSVLYLAAEWLASFVEAALCLFLATTLYVVVALLVSGLLLYKSRPADLLILILCFLSALNLIDVVLLKAISLFSSDAIVASS